MRDFSMDALKSLRLRTGVGLTKCKEALESSQGNLEEAVVYLRKLGLAAASKKEHRETKEGIITALADTHGVALVEVNVETDFVANNHVFRSFVEDLIEEVLRHKVNSVDILAQLPSFRDPSLSIDDMRAVTMQAVGENIRVSRIAYYPTNTSKESIGMYSHGNGKSVAIVILSGSPKAGCLAKEIAMHIVAERPQFLSREEVPQEVIHRETEVISSQTEGKPQAVVDKIISGKLNTFFKETCLLEQPFVKNPEATIFHLLEDMSKTLEAPIAVKNFTLWKLGA